VPRQGASKVFFDIVGTFQAGRLIRDGAAGMAALEALTLDTLGGIEEAAGALGQQIQQVVDATVPLAEEIEKSRLEFQKFVSEVNASALTYEIEQIGLSFGFTGEQSLKAGSRMAQLSALLGEEVVPAATRAGIAFGLIGDMETEDAMNRLISLQQQTKFMFEDTTYEAYQQMSAMERNELATEKMAMTLNRLNSVEDHSAATMAQITAVMNEFASQAHLTGESMNFMAAMSAVLIEAGEQQGKAGRSLRMTYARLGADINGSATAMEEYGVAVKGADGTLRPLSSILQDLQPTWQRLNSGQKQNLAQTVAGNRHYVRFIKIMENFDRVKSLEIEAREQTAAVMDAEGNAIGYLDDLQQSNIITLKGLRAELDLVRASIGDRLIPGIISATEFQIEFNRAFEQMLGSAPILAEALGRIVGMQQVMSNVFAPFFTAWLNIKGMNLALMTHMAVMRAVHGQRLTIAGSEMTMTDAKIMGSAMEIENSKFLLTLEQSKQKKYVENAELALATAKIRQVQYREELMAASSYNAISRTSTNQELMQLEIRTGIAKIDQAILNFKKLQNRLDNYAGNNARTIAKYEGEVAKAKDIILKYAVQINKAQQNQVITLQGQNVENAKIIQRLDLMLPKWRLLLTNADQFEAELKQINGQMEFMNFQLSESTMKWNAMMAGAMIADMVIMTISKSVMKLLGVTDAGVRASRMAMIAMNLSMIIMMASIGAAMVQMGQFMQQKALDAAVTETDAQAHRNLANAQIAVASTAAAGASSLKKFAKLTVGWTIAIIGISFAIERLMNWLGVWDVKVDEIADTTEQFNFDWNTADWDVPDIDYGLDNVTDQIQDFSNKREELFFGFKAGAVTGDLIKQVQVGGVDNFVANTEIIMRNEFHGMTTQEAANEIISLIQEEGEKQGYSFG
tara:strand:+ start:51 stop:2783 length:2733 start_codon:yes stop_codon:yes gene_type:complete